MRRVDFWPGDGLKWIRSPVRHRRQLGRTVSGMTEQSPAVTISHPPEALLRAANPIVRYLLRTPLAGSLFEQMMVVSFSGARPGAGTQSR